MGGGIEFSTLRETLNWLASLHLLYVERVHNLRLKTKRSSFIHGLYYQLCSRQRGTIGGREASRCGSHETGNRYISCHSILSSKGYAVWIIS